MSSSYRNLDHIEAVQVQWLTAPTKVYGTRFYTPVTNELRKWWPDYQVCAMCPKARGRLGEVEFLYEADKYKKCGMCLEDEAVCMFDFSVPNDFNLSPERMATALDAYALARKAVNDSAQENHDKVANSRDVRLQDQVPVKVASKESRLNERQAWCTLTGIAFDFVRPRLMMMMDKFNDTYEQVANEDGEDCFDMGDDVKRMIKFLERYVMLHNLRIKVNGVPKIYCYAHNTIGHAFPLNGRMAYKSCWICDKDATVGIPTPLTAPEEAPVVAAARRANQDDCEDDDEKVPGKTYD